MRSLRSGSFIKWFYFGMHIKRWLVLVLLGVAIMGLGFGYVLREVYATYTFPTWVYYLTLQFVPRLVRAAMFIGVASSVILFAVWKLNTSLLAAFVEPDRDDSIVDSIYRYRYQARGPQGRRHRRRHRAARAAARPQGVHQQHHGDRHGRRRRRLLRPAATRAGRAAAGRPAQLHRRAGRGRAADDAPVPVPLQRRLRPRRPQLRQPVHRRDVRHHRQLRRGRARDQPRPRGARPDPALDAGST